MVRKDVYVSRSEFLVVRRGKNADGKCDRQAGSNIAICSGLPRTLTSMLCYGAEIPRFDYSKVLTHHCMEAGRFETNMITKCKMKFHTFEVPHTGGYDPP